MIMNIVALQHRILIRPFTAFMIGSIMATANGSTAANVLLINISPLKEGLLLKRQRGLAHDSLRRLKFQQRYISLTKDSVSYHKTTGPDHKKGEKRGEFPVSRLRIVEKVPDSTFQLPNCFQIGDNDEVMYFRAKTENERRDWMEALLIAATLKHNHMLEVYHIGAYGQVDHNKWSCCNAANRNTPGCQRTKVPQDRRMTRSMLIDDHGPDIELVDRRYSVATCSSPDTQSIDSGYPLDSTKFGGSQFSVSSRQSDPDSELSRSTSITSKLAHEQKTIPEDKPLESVPNDNGWNVLGLYSKSEVTSAVFRGTKTLIVAHKDGPIQIYNTRNFDKGDGFECISDNEPVGSVDIWKHYLAIGSLDLRLVNLNCKADDRKTLLKQIEGKGCPHLVVFTPRGRLFSYNQSQPNTITLWPEVESLWSASDVESEGCLRMENANGVESLLVSPNPSQPWLAVSTSSPKQLQIYDYVTCKLRNKFDLAEKEKTVASFTPSGEYIAVGRQKSLTFHGIDSKSPIFTFPEFDTSITSLAHNLWSRDDHIVVGFSSGEINVYSGLTGSPKLLMSLDDKKAQSGSVTCLAYSNDGQTLAAGSSDGKVKLWKVPRVIKSGNEAVSLVREGEMRVDSRGKQYISPDDGYTISIPPGAIAEGKTVTFKYGVVPDGPFGPFEFPDGVRPVSAILSLHPITEEPLLKPIEIAQPHFIHCETQEDQKRLAVYKADCHNDVKEGPDGRMLYSFKKMTNVKLSLGTYNGDPNYPEGIPYAKYSTCHPCYLCIGEYGKDETDKAIFSLIEVKPKTLNQLEELVIHFCLPYFLPTCHKTIRDQYPEEVYDLNLQSVKFSLDTTCDPAIGMCFEECLGQWLFNLQGGKDKKIYQNEVCFWEYPTPYYVKEMCQEKLYPPRFSVLVCGPIRPNDMVKAEFKFPGAEVFPGRGEPAATIYFPLQAQRSLFTGLNHVNSEISVVSETISCAPTINHPISLSTQQSLQPAARAFKACMCDLDKLHPSQLALTLFSKDLIDDTYFERIQESMKSTEKDEMVIRSEILLKIYGALKADASLYTPLHQVLLKLSPDSAKKFASEMSQLSREGSVASMPTVSTLDRSTSINFPAENLEHETHLPEPDKPKGGTSPLATPTQESAASSE